VFPNDPRNNTGGINTPAPVEITDGTPVPGPGPTTPAPNVPVPIPAPNVPVPIPAPQPGTAQPGQETPVPGSGVTTGNTPLPTGTGGAGPIPAK
jgi:hypothetical protein